MADNPVLEKYRHVMFDPDPEMDVITLIEQAEDRVHRDSQIFGAVE